MFTTNLYPSETLLLLDFTDMRKCYGILAWFLLLHITGSSPSTHAEPREGRRKEGVPSTFLASFTLDDVSTSNKSLPPSAPTEFPTHTYTHTLTHKGETFCPPSFTPEGPQPSSSSKKTERTLLTAFLSSYFVNSFFKSYFSTYPNHEVHCLHCPGALRSGRC